MGRPAAYLLADGTRVPGVTTVLGNLDKPGLLYWANTLGLEGKTLEDGRKKATDIGTLAHILIEAECKNAPLTFDPTTFDPNVLLGAQQALEMFREWRAVNSFRVLSAETSIVSETRRVGGCFDVCAIAGRRRVMIDWKTSKDVYAENWMQVAAYGALWNEAHPDLPIEGYAILRLGKEAPSFDHMMRLPNHPVIVDGLACFDTLRVLHDQIRALKKVMS